MATKKAGGSSKNGRDSRGRRLGLKKTHDQSVKIGMIILRQRGSRYLLGKNVFYGKDYTVHAAIEGKVKFFCSVGGRTHVSVESHLIS